MRVRKHKSKNHYIPAGEVWVRDLTRQNVVPQDVNALVSARDYRLVVANEHANSRLGLPQVDTEGYCHRKVLIVSDGHDFARLHRVCSRLGPDVAVLATNTALGRWELVGPNCPAAEKRAVTYYVVNNPYPECLSFVPRRNRYYPKCIASARTNTDFVSHYLLQRGVVYRYQPTPEEGFSGTGNDALWTVDDYRNPVCAAVSLAQRFEAEKIALLACDQSFADPRPGAVALENGLYAYPQSLTHHAILDAMFHWLRSQKDRDMEVADCSGGPKYRNARYITPDSLADFFS